MFFVSLFIFVSGAALLLFGFKKNNRALLTIAAFLWLVSGALEGASTGFIKGFNSSASGVTSTPSR